MNTNKNLYAQIPMICDVTIGFNGNEHEEQAEFIAWLGWGHDPDFALVRFFAVEEINSEIGRTTVHASRVHNIRRGSVA